MIHTYYQPVVPAWVANILSFEKQTGNIHHPDKARGQTQKDWQEWKRRYSRKLKYARMNGWIVETDAMNRPGHQYDFLIRDAEGIPYHYHHKAEWRLSPAEIAELEKRILLANPRATTCKLYANRNPKSITLNVTYEIDGDVSVKEVKDMTNHILQRYRNDAGFVFEDEDSFVEGIIVDAVELAAE